MAQGVTTIVVPVPRLRIRLADLTGLAILERLQILRILVLGVVPVPVGMVVARALLPDATEALREQHARERIDQVKAHVHAAAVDAHAIILHGPSKRRARAKCNIAQSVRPHMFNRDVADHARTRAVAQEAVDFILWLDRLAQSGDVIRAECLRAFLVGEARPGVGPQGRIGGLNDRAIGCLHVRFHGLPLVLDFDAGQVILNAIQATQGVIVAIRGFNCAMSQCMRFVVPEPRIQLRDTARDLAQISSFRLESIAPPIS